MMISLQKTPSPKPLNQIIIQKQAVMNPNPCPKPKPILFQIQPRRTNPLVWFGAIVCLIFSLIVIFLGIATLIAFLVIRPKIPVFDAPNARLSTVYFDAAEYLNGDFAVLANFTNPNRKLEVKFEYSSLELYFGDRLISAQSLQPFAQRPRETRLESIHMVSSLVYLPRSHAVALRTQVLSNRVSYEIRASFKVRASLGGGFIHFNYWFRSRCQLLMTGPPFGVLVARNCVTKR